MYKSKYMEKDKLIQVISEIEIEKNQDALLEEIKHRKNKDIESIKGMDMEILTTYKQLDKPSENEKVESETEVIIENNELPEPKKGFWDRFFKIFG